MTATAQTATATGRRPSLPGPYRTRVQVELKEFFRQRESVIFTLAFPVLLLLAHPATRAYPSPRRVLPTARGVAHGRRRAGIVTAPSRSPMA